MKIKVGDKVLVKDTIARGIVTKINNNHSVTIEDEHGFLIEYSNDKLIVANVEQSELSKYSDINNKMLREKVNYTEKKSYNTFKKNKDEKYGVVLEIDLHIEKLVRSKSGMSNFDILNKQLDTAKHQIEFAIKKRIPKIVFIHGVGEGILKEELFRLINRYDNTQYYEASYQKYGLGATEVRIN